MSRAATRNPDRRRELRQETIPAPVRALLEPGATAYTMGGCRIIVAQLVDRGWHLSISRAARLPSWEEVREVRYALVPDDVTMAMLLPPRSEYVNAHDFCFHLWEVSGESVA